MRNNVRSFGLIVPGMVLVGCSTSNVAMIGAKTYPPVAVSHVQVLYKEPTRPYEVIALIKHQAVWIGSSQGEIKKARELAAQAGADALLIYSAENDSFYDWAKASGKAIRWK